MLILYRVNAPGLRTEWAVWGRPYQSAMLRDAALDVLLRRIERSKANIEAEAAENVVRCS